MEIKLPAKLQYLSLIRMVLTAICRQSLMDEESIDDLKIAVSEFLGRVTEAKLTDTLTMKTTVSAGVIKIYLGSFNEFDPHALFTSSIFTFDTFKTFFDNYKQVANGSGQQVILEKKLYA